MALAGWSFPADDERLLWFYTPTDHGGLPMSDMRPAQQRHAMQLVAHRPVTGRVRDGLDDHRSGERARRARGLERRMGARAGPRPGAVLRARVRRPRRGRHVGVAVRWAPRLDQPHHRRRRGRRFARRASSAPTRRRRRCSVRTRSDRSPVPRTSAGSSSDRSTTHNCAAAMLSPVAPVDLVTGNRARLSEGDQALPLTDIWRRTLHR